MVGLLDDWVSLQRKIESCYLEGRDKFEIFHFLLPQNFNVSDFNLEMVCEEKIG